jgi:aryl-alcohol dehydrogenase-like predicted oxidoreductase
MSEFYGTCHEGESIATIHRAVELGITFLDTADMYWAPVSLGALGPRKRAQAAQPLPIKETVIENQFRGSPLPRRAACSSGL